MKSLGVLLAAGGSVRFGASDKLLADWRGRPLVSWAASALADAGCDALLAVVSSQQVARALPATFTPLPIAPGLPMSQSFRLALEQAQRLGAERLLLALGDMPNIDAGLLRRLMLLPEGGACVTSRQRLPPALIPAADFDTALAAGDGDFGARAFIAALPQSRLIRIASDQAHDVDLPQDLDPPDCG